MNRIGAIFTIIFLFAATFYSQTQHTNQERGFNADRAYSSFDIDHINTFNGNLVINIPLGQPYKVGGNLSYSFNLVYNSFIWSNETQCSAGASAVNINYHFSSLSTLHRSVYSTTCVTTRPGFIGIGFCPVEELEVYQIPSLLPNGVLEVPGHVREGPDCTSMATINPASNAGVGWQLSFGKIYRPRTDLNTVQPHFTGKLYEVYQSPDGSEHQFYPTLHEGESDNSSGEEPDLYYTRDGSYIRMYRNRTPETGYYQGQGGYTYILYFPNGEKHYFQRMRVQNADTTEYGLTYSVPFDEDKIVRIVDQFGNAINFDYYDDASDTDDDDGAGQNIEIRDNLMVVSDSVGRQHKIEFFKPINKWVTLIKAVKLESFNGTTAQYTLRYGESPEDLANAGFTDKVETPTKLASPHAQPGEIPGYNTGTGEEADKIKVPYLTSVQLPEGGMKYAMPIVLDPNRQEESYYQPLNESIQTLAPGALRRLTLPTGAEIQWDYSVVCDPNEPTNIQCDLDPAQDAPNGGKQRYGYFFSTAMSGRAAARLSPGVRRRHLIFKRTDPNTGGIAETERYTWKYDPLIGKMPAGCTPLRPADPCGPRHIVNKVTTPEGDFTKYFYSIYPHPQGANSVNGRDITQPHAADYGLPFTKDPNFPHKFDHGSPSKPLFLSTQTFARGAQTPIRETYVRYDMDKFIRSDGFSSASDTNQRLAASAAYYYDDSQTFDEIINSDFNGLGYYRKTERYSNFNNLTFPTSAPEPYYSSVETNYTRGGSFNIDPATNQPSPGSNFIPIPLNEPWITGLYDRVIRRDKKDNTTNSTGVREDYEFGNNGLLNRKRIYTKVAGQNEQPAPGEHDVLINYTYSPTGNLTVEEYSGGDKQNLNNNPAPEYKITYGYPNCGGGQLGVVKISQYLGGGGNTFTSADKEIDCATGWVKTSRDEAGYPTDYHYDLLGRVKNIYQGTEGSAFEASSTLIQYADVRNGNFNSAPTVRIFEYPTRQQTGAALTEKEFNYDKLGRLTIERMKMPDGRISLRDRKFNALGWKLHETEWLDESLWRACDERDPNSECRKRTRYENFDAFGRPTRIILPDGKVINRAYKGEREVYENMTVGAVASTTSVAVVEQLSERWTRYDQFGQVIQVEEQSGLNGAKIKTSYGYGVLGKLGWACSGSGTVQCRSFSYDGRGNLTAEAHPERGWSSYSGYDTMGNVGTSWDGVNALNYQYDFAGRPTTVQNHDGRLIKEFTYYTDNGGAGGAFSRGKLKTSRRFNYVVNPYEWSSQTPPARISIAVGELYKYSGVGGRASERVMDTSIPAPIGPSFRQTFTYDKLGNLSSQSYPECANQHCTGSNQQRPWSVNYAYSRNFLTGVGGGAGLSNPSLGTYAPSITYNINQTTGSITHGNNAVDTETSDPRNMQRVRQISTSRNNVNLWETGEYGYDGAGNITTIGSDWFLYDKAGRLKEGTALLGAPAQNMKQQYDYDTFGNITTVRTYDNVSRTSQILRNNHITNVVSATNRLNVNYDAAGNALGLLNSPPTYSYDELNMISTVFESSNQTVPRWTYLYGPSEERFWVIDNLGTPFSHSDNEEFFTLRGLNNEVLREYKVKGGSAVGNWFWQKDYIYRGTKLLAAETPAGRRHYHVDHLGSTRLVTDNSGAQRETVKYLPFGQTSGFFDAGAWSLTQTFGEPASRLRFTGHEKDTDVFGLNYMHARYYLESSGKFLSVDPGRDVDYRYPQSWNLYAYTLNNPVNKIDPDGRADRHPPLVAGASQVPEGYSASPLTVEDLKAADPGYQMSPFGGPLETAIIEYLADRAGGALLNKFVGGFQAVFGAKSGKYGADKPYKRPPGATTKAQRRDQQGKPCAKCGANDGGKRNAGHKKDLYQEYYENNGKIDMKKARSKDAVQPECPTCSNKGGAEARKKSMEIRKRLFGY